jgi:hypothetical protein
VLLHVFEPHETIPLMMGCSVISQMITADVAQVGPVCRQFDHALGGVAGVALAVTSIGARDPPENVVSEGTANDLSNGAEPPPKK